MSKCPWCRGVRKPCAVPAMVRFRKEANSAIRGCGTTCPIPVVFQDDCATRSLAEDSAKLDALVADLRLEIRELASESALAEQAGDHQLGLRLSQYAQGLDALLAAHGFQPDAQDGQEPAQEATGSVTGPEAAEGSPTP